MQSHKTKFQVEFEGLRVVNAHFQMNTMHMHEPKNTYTCNSTSKLYL